MKKVTTGDPPASGAAKGPASSTSRAAALPDLSQYGRLAEYNRKR
jgi:hypothetical protein